MSCPNAFVHRKRANGRVVRGDDFLVAGPESQVKLLKEQMNQHDAANHEVLGPGEGQKKEAKVLNGYLVEEGLHPDGCG